MKSDNSGSTSGGQDTALTCEGSLEALADRPDLAVAMSRLPDDVLKRTIRRGLLTGQLAVGDSVALTEKASPRFRDEVSTALRAPLWYGVDPPSPLENSAVLEESYSPTVKALLAEIAAANRRIDTKYGEASGTLGNPISGLEYGAKDSYFRRYEHGAIYLSAWGEAHYVHGPIYEKYVALGAEAGFLGLPRTDTQSTGLLPGLYNHFQGGSIYWSAATGASEIHGPIRDKWWFLEGINGYLGFPISDEENWRDANGTVAGRISHFQRGSLIFRFADEITLAVSDSVILTTWLGASSVGCSAELWMNSVGDWRFKGHMHNSGFVGFNVTVVSTPRVQDGAGRIFAVSVERHVGGTTSSDDRDNDWDQAGSGEPFIRDNWDAIRVAGMRTVMDVDTTLGDVVELIGFGFPIAVGAVVAGSILGGGQICGPYGSMRRDPYTREDHGQVNFEVRDAGDNCACPIGQPH
jgi:hypothetical protein